jgi:hypothetical protein
MAAHYLKYLGKDVDFFRASQEAAYLNRRNANHDLRWYGKKAVQDATHWADSTTLTPYRCISGASTWGAGANDEALVFGTADLLWNDPATLDVPAYGIFDQILFHGNSSATVYRFRLIYGRGAQSMADSIANNQYTETMYFRANADTTRIIRPLRSRRLPIDCQIWGQCANASDNATLDFFVGVHYYEYTMQYHPTVI